MLSPTPFSPTFGAHIRILLTSGKFPRLILDYSPVKPRPSRLLAIHRYSEPFATIMRSLCRKAMLISNGLVFLTPESKSR
jgi:hypothetical protein